MDPHQAAYWLSKSPEEAAEFLAKTAVASRRVGGFVKRGSVKSGYDWQGALNQLGDNATLRHALIGAGVGGLGGLGVGMLNRKKKSPWATALTGAALGGLGAGAGSYLWNNPPTGLFSPTPEGANAQMSQSKRLAEARESASSGQKLLSDITGEEIEPPSPAGQPAASGGGTPSPQDPLAAVKSRESMLGKIWGTATGDHGVAAPVVEHFGLGYVQKKHFDRLRAMDKVDAFMAGNTPDPGDPRTGKAPNLAAQLQPTHDDMIARQGRLRNTFLGSMPGMPNIGRAEAGEAVLRRASGQAAPARYSGLGSVGGSQMNTVMATPLPKRGIGGAALTAAKYVAPHIGIGLFNHFTNPNSYGGGR